MNELDIMERRNIKAEIEAMCIPNTGERGSALHDIVAEGMLTRSFI